MATLYSPIIFGYTFGDLGDHTRAPARNIALSPVADVTLVGDANALLDHAVGGGNTLSIVSVFASATLVGDALSMSDQAHGGDNNLTLIPDLFGGEAVGDAISMSGHASGGHNTIDISGGRVDPTIAIGDAETMTDHAQGGGNTLDANGFRDQLVLIGDALSMSGHAVGGGNTLVGAEALFMYGDAQTLSGQSHGGHNTLIDATKIGDIIEAPTVMYGDGLEILDHASGGYNTLVAGFSADIMWGSAPVVGPDATTGPNRFVFDTPISHDLIKDFRPGEDVIELDGFGFASFSDLASHFQDTPSGVLISFSGLSDILLSGISASQLHASDFLFH